MVATAPPKPLMFVPREMDHKWIGNFMKKKHHALSRFIGKTETSSLYFSLSDFTDLIKRISAVNGAEGIKVYFASYCPTDNAEVNAIADAGHVDQLTLIFAATDSGRNDLGAYFLLKPDGGILTLSKETANTLVKCYQHKKMPLLTAIIKDAGHPTFKETKSIWYPLDYFDGPYDFIKELKTHDAAGITAFIGCYGDDETTPGGKSLCWQLNMVFVPVKAVNHDGTAYHYHFDLENTPGWADRPDAPNPRSDFEGADTGNPCPPAICGGGLGNGG